MHIKWWIAGLGLIAAQPVSAQYYDPTIALRVRPPAPILFPDPTIAMQQIQAIEAARAQAERDRAEARLLNQQTAALEAQQRGESRQQLSNSTPSAPPASNPIIEKWLIAAQPRMHLYSDFDKVVFAKDVTITEEMIDLMSQSGYAADIAYYLGSHRAEALAISSMTTYRAALAISEIEKRFINNGAGK